METEFDYYLILGIQPEAGAEEVRRAFRERVRACHPDRVANLDADLQHLAAEKMVQLNKAYAVLRNPARRAAYDDRRMAMQATPPIARPSPLAQPAPPPPVEETAARNRIGEQTFVTRAASEEFQTRLKQSLGGHTKWTPAVLAGTTLAVQATLGRSDYYFVLFAAPTLDEKALRRFLRTVESWSSKLSGKWWGREMVLGFAAAVEFTDTDRLRRRIEQFNSRKGDNDRLGPVTLVDLVNWNAFPGNTDLASRLKSLVRG
ncbi:MAG: J domain-containing protein [Acidobacteriota bacterium]